LLLGDPAGGGDQLVSDRDQLLSDRDQTASDQDQTWSDHDQTASERDQRTADEDQDAADDDFAAGGDASVYHRNARAREHSSRDRAAISSVRDETAASRLKTAEDRDRAAALRDRGGEGRDQLGRLHDLEDDMGASRQDIISRAERDRARAAADRAKAADDRARSAIDRESSAEDRAQSHTRRGEPGDRLNLVMTDELTGAWSRRFGVEEVSREIERAHRTGGKLTLAFIDVDHLKALNDSDGHLAGDGMLRMVAATVRANIRRYDVLVRYGGDEFVCATPNLGVAHARQRFEKVAAELALVNTGHSIAFGLADAQPLETVQDLIDRGAAELFKEGRSRKK
jgi:diguanylate cyclase (GGDEF)-like protein